MSHTTTIQTRIQGPHAGAALARACKKVNAALLEDGREDANHKLYDGVYPGIGVQLVGWYFPIVINPEDGTIKSDNYNGRWGRESELQKLLQHYASEVVQLEAQAMGHSLESETILSDGSIELTVSMW